DTVTVLPVPTFLSANAPVALPVLTVTVSPLTTPESAALVVFRVAVVFPSYCLLLAVLPVTVRAFGFTVWDKALEVLPLNVPPPLYTAVMPCVVAAREEVPHAA